MDNVFIFKTPHDLCDGLGFTDMGQELIPKTLAL